MKCKTYEEFLAKYKNLLNTMLQYETNQIGSRLYAEKLGELVESNPSEWEERADTELA